MRQQAISISNLPGQIWFAAQGSGLQAAVRRGPLPCTPCQCRLLLPRLPEMQRQAPFRVDSAVTSSLARWTVVGARPRTAPKHHSRETPFLLIRPGAAPFRSMPKAPQGSWQARRVGQPRASVAAGPAVPRSCQAQEGHGEIRSGSRCDALCRLFRNFLRPPGVVDSCPARPPLRRTPPGRWLELARIVCSDLRIPLSPWRIL